MRKRKLSAQKLAVLAFVQAHQPVQSDQVAAHLGSAQATASNHLKALVARRMLQKRRIDRHRWVWEIAGTAAPPVVAARLALAQWKLRAHEQVSSVWEYARRCA